MSKMDEGLTYPKVDGRETSKKFNLLSPKDVKGRTLDIYYYLIKNPSYHGVREIQRELNFSSASVVSYHLNRLLEIDTVDRNDQGQYKIKSKPVRLGYLENQFKIIRFWVPRTVIYSIVALLLAITSLILGIIDARAFTWSIIFTPTMVLFALILIYDGYKMTQNLKQEEQS
ncbi:MAG: hypothetical protein ACW99A_20910 [Candidatus Kariarchaeaceae archaeon]|jgi:hypothetical protein